jgi:hypothetical protein
MTTYYLTLYLDQDLYDFNCSLHSTREAAEAAFEDLMRRFIVPEGEPMPPKSEWSIACDKLGETPHMYEIKLDGGPAEQIILSEEVDVK